MWLLQGKSLLRTGPRKDRYRADEIRYHVRADGGANKDDGGVLAVWGAGPRRDFRARFRVRYAAPRDYWLARSGKDRAELSEGRAPHARVGLLFGLRNIETRTEYDEARRLTYYPDPMTGYAVLIEDGGIALARVRAEHRSGGASGHRELVPEVVHRIEVDTRSLDDLEVTVEIKKDRVTIQAAGKRATMQAPGYDGGYLGLAIHGHGYAAWSPIGSAAAGGRAK